MTKSGAMNTNIDIFLRVKPDKRPSQNLFLDQNMNKLEFNIPRDMAQGLVNNQREHYDFTFNGILSPEAKQDEVFERVARTVVAGALEGFNGTIFAYGQTGSGKTFTMTGGVERYVDRGIIPRSMSAIFAEVSKRSDYKFSVHISYLEIYNEIGYDLLDPDREVKALEDLPRVSVLEDEDQQISYRNLGLHLANNEEEALNVLFLGDTNRVIGATLMNQSSSRSHCIFTVHVEARKHGEDIVRRSKLNLVDLAGSERVSKTGADGKTLKQAKYINLSLHYLEQVIIALQERADGISRPHIPYRNSMMTMALKDSLGGNCRTTMVATISSEQLQIDESISTCRFAERVAMVRNTVAVNEEVDPTLVIRRLKAEVRDLKEEVRLLRGEDEQRGPLTPDEISRLQKQIEAYCSDTSQEASLNFGGSMIFIRAAFDVFKGFIQSGGLGKGSLSGGEASRLSKAVGNGDLPSDAGEQIKKLKMQVQQRDNEINILVSMLQRRDAGKATSGAAVSALQGGSPGGGFGSGLGPNALMHTSSGPSLLDQAASAPRPVGLPGIETPTCNSVSGSAAKSMVASVDDITTLMNTNLLGDRNKAFELFRKSYRQNEVIEENKLLLKQKYESAKNVGQAVNDSKQRITELKALIEQRRVQRAMMGQDQEVDADDPEETRCKGLIEEEKRRYKDSFNSLRDLKKEIEHLHLLLEQSRSRLQKDFDQWMALMKRQKEQQMMGGGSSTVPLSPAGSISVPPSPQRSVSLSRHPTSISSSPPQMPKQAWSDSPAKASPPPPASNTVDPRVLELARPYLTGNAEADEDIIRFYEAKSKLMAQMANKG